MGLFDRIRKAFSSQDDEEKIKAMKEEIANVEINTLKETLVKLGYDENEMLKLITENLKGEL